MYVCMCPRYIEVDDEDASVIAITHTMVHTRYQVGTAYRRYIYQHKVYSVLIVL